MNAAQPRLGVVRSVEPAPPALLNEPLAHLFAEHWRHRQFLAALAEVAGMAAAPPRLMRRLAQFLAHDWTLHVADEEGDLHRLLLARAEPEDDFERTLAILSADHDADRAAVRAIRQGLEEAAVAGVGPAAIPGLADRIGRFVAHTRRHMALENAIILPIARLRLTEEDLADLSCAMAARRA